MQMLRQTSLITLLLTLLISPAHAQRIRSGIAIVTGIAPVQPRP